MVAAGHLPTESPFLVHFRRLHALGAALLVGALSLTACGGGSDKKASPLDQVSVTGGTDKSAPTVKVEPQPLKVSETTTKVVKDGDGATVQGDEIVSIKYVLLNGKDSSVLDTNYGKQNLGLSLDAQDLLPGLKKGLKDQKVGSRVLVAMPPKDAFGTQGNTDIKVGGSDTIVFLMDLLSATNRWTPPRARQSSRPRACPRSRSRTTSPRPSPSPRAQSRRPGRWDSCSSMVRAPRSPPGRPCA